MALNPRAESLDETEEQTQRLAGGGRVKSEVEIGVAQPQARDMFPQGPQLSQQQNGTLDPQETVLSVVHPRTLRT